jgi:hypothetical protein
MIYKDITARFLTSLPEEYEFKKYLTVGAERDFYSVLFDLDRVHDDEEIDAKMQTDFRDTQHRLFISFLEEDRENRPRLLLGVGGVTFEGVIWVLWKRGALKRRCVRRFLFRGGIKTLLERTLHCGEKLRLRNNWSPLFNSLPDTGKGFRHPQIRWLQNHLGATLSLFVNLVLFEFYPSSEKEVHGSCVDQWP